MVEAIIVGQLKCASAGCHRVLLRLCCTFSLLIIYTIISARQGSRMSPLFWATIPAAVFGKDTANNANKTTNQKFKGFKYTAITSNARF